MNSFIHFPSFVSMDLLINMDHLFTNCCQLDLCSKEYSLFWLNLIMVDSLNLIKNQCLSIFFFFSLNYLQFHFILCCFYVHKSMIQLNFFYFFLGLSLCLFFPASMEIQWKCKQFFSFFPLPCNGFFYFILLFFLWL